MTTTFKQLAQARELVTDSDISVYSPPGGTETVIRNIVMCNQSASSTTFRMFLDDDGTTYDESTALYFDVPIDANVSITFDTFLTMNNSDGNFAYRTASGSDLTITLSGLEIA